MSDLNDLKEAREIDRYLLDGNEGEFERMQVCYRYVTHDQWEPGIRQELLDKQRPVLEIDLISPIVNTFVGIEHDFRSGMEALPMEGGDQDTSAIYTYILKYLNRNKRIERMHSRVNKDVAICGIGWIDNHIRKGDDFMGEIDPRRESPFRVKRDPQGLEIDQRDWNYMSRDRWMTDKQIEAEWPDADITPRGPDMKAEEIQNMVVEDDKDYFQGNSINFQNFIDPARGKRRVWEIYERKNENSDFIILEASGQIRSLQDFLNDPQGADMLNYARVYHQQVFEPKNAKELVEILTGAGINGLGVLSKEVSTIEMGTFTVGVVLSAMEPLPYNHGEFPLIPVFGYVAERKDGRLRVHGLVEGLVGLQDQKNKRSSQALDILIHAPKAGGFFRKNMGVTEEDLNAMQISGKWLGTDRPFDDVIKEREQKYLGILNNVAQMEQQSESDITNSSGMPRPMQGQATSAKESGVLAQTRIRQGMMGISELMENLDTAKITMYKQDLSYVQQYWSREKVRRVIGDKDLDVSDEAIAAFLQNYRALKYDVVMNPESSPTARRWNLMKALEMLQYGMPPQLMLQPLLELSDFPGKDRILEQLKQLPQDTSAGSQNEIPLQ